MRLKTYYGADVAEALEQVRAELGRNAIIVSTLEGRGDKPCQVTAALDTQEEEAFQEYFQGGETRGASVHLRSREAYEIRLQEVQSCLEYHRVPDFLINDFISGFLPNAFGGEQESLEDTLVQILTPCMSHQKLDAGSPVMLIGPPGAGKTVALAKLAAALVLENQSVFVISTDAKAGAYDQLNSYMKALGQGAVHRVQKGSDLKKTMLKAPMGSKILIDTMGTNPFSNGDLEELGDFVVHSGVTPTLVIPGGLDALEAQDMREVFERLGVKRLISTRLDLTRRLGGIVTTAALSNLSLSLFGDNPHIGVGLESMDVRKLAQKLLQYSKMQKEDHYG